MTKKILKMCSTNFFAVTVLQAEINYFSRNGYSIDLICATDNHIKKVKGCKLINLNIKREISPVSFIFNLIQLIKITRAGRYDIVHTHNHVVGILGRLAAKICGVNTIIHTAHGFFFHERMSIIPYYFYFIIEKLVGRFTDLIFIESMEDVETVIKRRMLKKSQVLHIGGGINLKKYSKNSNSTNLLQEYKINKDNVIIGITGRITIEKGYRELIFSFNQLKLEHPKIHLIIIGANLESERDPYYDSLVDFIKEKELSNHVTITFISDHIPPLLDIMDIFVLPSSREGYPRSIMEAMAASLPVITTNIRGCREEVIHEHNGLIIEPKNTKQLTEALTRLINNSTERKLFGQNGHYRALKYYDEKKLFKKIINGYESIL